MMGECYWCHSPLCDPWGSCREPDYNDLELMEIENGGELK